MAHDPKLLQSILASAAPPDLDVTFRPMFGGLFAYADGKPFASLSDVGLALKFVGSERDAILALPGAALLRYEPDQPASKILCRRTRAHAVGAGRTQVMGDPQRFRAPRQARL